MVDGFGETGNRFLYNVLANYCCRIILSQPLVLQMTHMYYLHPCGSGVQAFLVHIRSQLGLGSSEAGLGKGLFLVHVAAGSLQLLLDFGLRASVPSRLEVLEEAK